MTRKTQEIIPTSEFINLYKEYETVLRDTMNSNPYAYESTQPQQISNKLQIIRLNRNYIQHESDPDFVKISRDQYEFLQQVINDVKLTQGTAKDGMIPIRKYPHLFDDMRSSEAVEVFAGTVKDRVPVLCRQSGRFLGMCSAMQLLKYINNTSMSTKLVPQRSSKLKLKLEEAPTIETDSLVYNLNPDQLYVVTKNEKVVGILPL